MMGKKKVEIAGEQFIVNSGKLGPLTEPLGGQSALAMRLARYYQIERSELELLDNMPSKKLAFKPGSDILSRGSEINNVMVLVSGWAIRSRFTPEGARQIIHVLLPGDIVTPNALVIERTDHSISSLTDTLVRFVHPSELAKALWESKQLAAAFWWASEQEYGILREQIVRLGRRSAFDRVAHFLLELHRRLALIGLASEGQFFMPLTQVEIADALGLSHVHIYRTLKKLVKEGFIKYRGSVVELLDRSKLAERCDFDAKHLHLDSTISTAAERGIR